MTESSRGRWIAIFVMFLVAGTTFGFLVDNFLDVVVALGYKIPQRFMAMDYASGVILAALIGVAIVISPLLEENKKALFVLWIARCFVTLVAMLFYENHYVLDTFIYFKEANAPEFHWSFQFGNGTMTVSWIAWTINKAIPTFGTYHSLKVLWSACGLLGVYLFYRGVCRYTETKDVRVLYFLGLYPSIIFWSSIFGKDPIAFLGLGAFCYGAFGILKEVKLRFIVFMVIGVFLASMIRFWLGLIFIAPLSLAILFKSDRSPAFKYAVLTLIVAAGAALSKPIMAQFKIEDTQSVVERSRMVSNAWGKGGSAQEVPEFNSIGDLLRFAPKGMFAALFRPLPGEIMNPFGLVAGFENAFLLWLVFFGLRRMKREYWRDPYITYSLGLLLFWSLLYSFVSYQNLGTASRFKLQVLPVLVLLPLYIYHRSRTEGVSQDGTSLTKN